MAVVSRWGFCALKILLNYWKKRIPTTLQIGNVSIISEAYRRLFNFGAETILWDFDVERTFHFIISDLSLVLFAHCLMYYLTVKH